MRRIGVLGGSFDPVHVAHVELAQRALAQVPLDEAWMLPATQPPHKPHRALVSAEHRLRMLQLAVAGRPGLSICTHELDDPGVHYSVDTMEFLRGRYPETAFWFLMGEDSLLDLPTWRQPDRLLRLAAPVVAPRLALPGAARDGVGGHLPFVFGVRVTWLRGEPIDLASSALRAALARGETPAGIAGEVLQYIRTHGLYRATGAGGLAP